MPSKHGHRPNLALLDLHFSPRKPGCERTPPCARTMHTHTLQLFTGVFSPLHFPGHVLENKVRSRPKPSATALRRSPFMMEMLLWTSALSQKCPLLVPACWHKTATQQDYDQAASALRPYTNTKAQKERVEVENEHLGKTKRRCCLAVLLCRDSSPPPLHTGTGSAAPEKVLQKRSWTNKSLQGPLFCFKRERAQLVITQLLGHRRQVDTELGMV